MVRHYALLYGFHTLQNMLIKPLRESRGFVYVYKCLTCDLSGDLCETHQGQGLFFLFGYKDNGLTLDCPGFGVILILSTSNMKD